MKKTAKTFLKVGKILNIIAIICMSVTFLVGVILLIIGGVEAAAGETELGAATVASGVECLVSGIIWTGFEIASLILNGIATKEISNAKCKAEAKKGAIMAIVSGAIGSAFPIASGIFCLVMSEEAFKADVEGATVAAQPAEVVVEAKVEEPVVEAAAVEEEPVVEAKVEE